MGNLRAWFRFLMLLAAVGALTAAGTPALQTAPPLSQASAQPDLTAVKADFVPGDKIIFYDDFSDMVGDEPPPHWKVRGGAVELRVGAGIRQLTVMSERARLVPMLKGFVDVQ